MMARLDRYTRTPVTQDIDEVNDELSRVGPSLSGSGSHDIPSLPFIDFMGPSSDSASPFDRDRGVLTDGIHALIPGDLNGAQTASDHAQAGDAAQGSPKHGARAIQDVETQSEVAYHSVLDEILPRPLLLELVDLFFDYVFPLIPCVHRPSFIADIHAGRGSRQGEDEWSALVMVIMGVTLAQVPRAFVKLDKKEVRGLIDKITRAVKQYLDKDFTSVSTSRCACSSCSLSGRVATDRVYRYHTLSVGIQVSGFRDAMSLTNSLA